MCTNYRAPRRELFAASYDAEPPAEDWREDVYRDYAAPIVRRGADGGREARLATFGLSQCLARTLRVATRGRPRLTAPFVQDDIAGRLPFELGAMSELRFVGWQPSG